MDIRCHSFKEEGPPPLCPSSSSFQNPGETHGGSIAAPLVDTKFERIGHQGASMKRLLFVDDESRVLDGLRLTLRRGFAQFSDGYDVYSWQWRLQGP
jgi:hypothetical protein